ncbi:hypothetical protein DFJ74DRAFT_702925 [Hyaloraphidium curvatum]|nr:hypothetical protein DFJ74DRAFT_702925 [Hyaloraphidium curvatum]
MHTLPKSVFVLGGTGLIGVLTLKSLLSRGHSVTAYVRTPSKVPVDLLSKYPDTLHVVQGSIDSKEQLVAALTARLHDAVVSSIGPVDLRGHVAGTLAASYRTIAAAMKEAGVTRIYALSTFSYTTESDKFSFGRNFTVGVVTLLIPASKSEFVQIAKVFNEEGVYGGIDWTVFRVGMLKDGGSPQAVRSMVISHAELPPGEPGKVSAGTIGASESSGGITRSGIAQWLTEQVEKNSREWVGKLPYISNI